MSELKHRRRRPPARRPHHVRPVPARAGQARRGHQRAHLADRAEPGQPVGQLAQEGARRHPDVAGRLLHARPQRRARRCSSAATNSPVLGDRDVTFQPRRGAPAEPGHGGAARELRAGGRHRCATCCATRARKAAWSCSGRIELTVGAETRAARARRRLLFHQRDPAPVPQHRHRSRARSSPPARRRRSDRATTHRQHAIRATPRMRCHAAMIHTAAPTARLAPARRARWPINGQAFIDGRYVAGRERRHLRRREPDRRPRASRSVASTDQADVDRAVAAARRAFEQRRLGAAAAARAQARAAALRRADPRAPRRTGAARDARHGQADRRQPRRRHPGDRALHRLVCRGGRQDLRRGRADRRTTRSR